MVPVTRAHDTGGMQHEAIRRALRDIGLALNATHNTVATDRVGATPDDEYSWTVDHRREIGLVHELEAMLLTNTDTDLGCADRSNDP